jgi:capsular exopolysaccharide synthesis family protein
VDPSSSRSNFERGVDILRRRGLWILPCCVLAAAAAFAYSKHQTKKYTATASLVFKGNQLTQQIAGLPASLSTLAAQNNNVKLVQVGDMAEKTASRLGKGLTEQVVSGSLSIAQQGETSAAGEAGIVDVSASVTSPSLAAAIANTYAEQFVAEQQASNHRFYTSALATVSKQLAALPRKQRLVTAGAALQNRADELKFLAEQQYGGVQLAQRAPVPTSASSPSTSKDTLIGGVLGLLIGLGLVLVLERLDPRIREPEELETIYRSPLLGVVPESKSLSPPVQSAPDTRLVLPSAEAETFSLILAHLRSFNSERDLRTVLATSAAPCDGTTTVSLHLAEAAAKSGSRTLLIELDLRRPTLAQHHLCVQSGPGLREVLTDAIAIGDAVQSINLPVPAGGGITTSTLDVLTSGTAQPSSSPGELIKSHTMEAVLDQMKSTYDLVIIDTPSLMVVSDAFPVLRKVDGVLVVSRIGHDRRDVAERLQQILDRSAVPLLGVIANRFNWHRGRGYDPYTYDYVEDDKLSPAAASANEVVSSSEETQPLTRT